MSFGEVSKQIRYQEIIKRAKLYGYLKSNLACIHNVIDYGSFQSAQITLLETDARKLHFYIMTLMKCLFYIHTNILFKFMRMCKIRCVIFGF